MEMVHFALESSFLLFMNPVSQTTNLNSTQDRPNLTRCRKQLNTTAAAVLRNAMFPRSVTLRRVYTNLMKVFRVCYLKILKRFQSPVLVCLRSPIKRWKMKLSRIFTKNRNCWDRLKSCKNSLFKL